MPIDTRLSYLQKHRFAPRQIDEQANPALGIVVVIPSYCEPDLHLTLQSLAACELPVCAVEVIVVINASERASDTERHLNKESRGAATQWMATYSGALKFHLLDFSDLPKKHAGVGLARKIGMDEAVDRLEQAQNPAGIILCLDADSQVAPNYLQAVFAAFQHAPKAEAACIYFEHPLAGEAFESDIYRGITRYELFLRYYVQALRFGGYPYAMHTVGSSMAVRSSAYQRQGGMNRRKAGEDFYFLHKFIPRGQVIEIRDTRVIPSPRAAQKVPFGTGRAIQEWLDGDLANYPTYAPQTFQDLGVLCAAVPGLYRGNMPDVPEPVAGFLAAETFEAELPELRKHVASEAAFVKRFYQWFDGLKVLKFVHHTRDHEYPEVDVLVAARTLWEWKYGDAGVVPGDIDKQARFWLAKYRNWDQQGNPDLPLTLPE